MTLLDTAVYDEDSRMLRGFLHGVHEHLNPGGEAWLVMGIRSQEEMLAEFGADETTSLWRLRPSGASPFVEEV